MIGALELAGELLVGAIAGISIAVFLILALGGALDPADVHQDVVVIGKLEPKEAARLKAELDNYRGRNGGAASAGESAPAPQPSSPVNPHLGRFDKRLWDSKPAPTLRDRLRCLVRGHVHPRWRPNHRMRKHMARRFRLQRWPDEHSFPMGPCQRCGREA